MTSTLIEPDLDEQLDDQNIRHWFAICFVCGALATKETKGKTSKAICGKKGILGLGDINCKSCEEIASITGTSNVGEWWYTCTICGKGGMS